LHFRNPGKHFRPNPGLFPGSCRIPSARLAWRKRIRTLVPPQEERRFRAASFDLSGAKLRRGACRSLSSGRANLPCRISHRVDDPDRCLAYGAMLVNLRMRHSEQVGVGKPAETYLGIDLRALDRRFREPILPTLLRTALLCDQFRTLSPQTFTELLDRARPP